MIGLEALAVVVLAVLYLAGVAVVVILGAFVLPMVITRRARRKARR